MVEELPELRYSDGPSVEVDMHIEAAPEDVWALVSDIQLSARFGTEFLGAEFLDGATGPAAGARFVGRSQHPAVGEWETVCTIVEFDPERVFGYVVEGLDGPSSHWRFTLSAERFGTRLTQWMRMGPARSFINVAIDSMPDKETRILRRRLAEHRANMEANLRGVKELLES
jgi:polyketide cyclase/dehydrase/lipid transport protein